MRKNICIGILFLLLGFNAFAQCLSNSTADCTEENDYCIPNPSISHVLNSDPFYSSHNLHTCLGSEPDPSWVMFKVAHGGDLLIYIEQYSQYDNVNCRPNTSSTSLDIDFACWGPFPDTIQSAKRFKQYLCENRFTLQSNTGGGPGTHRPTNGNHTNDMGGYPYNTSPNNPYNIALTDCSYHSAGTEWCFLPNTHEGDWYLLLICNYSRQSGYFKFTTLHSPASGSNNYQGNTNCDLLNCLSTNQEMPCEGNPFKLYCNVPVEDINTHGQPLRYKWIAPHSTDTIITTDSVITLIADTSMTGTFELILGGTNPPRRGFLDITVQATPAAITASETVICKGDSVVLSTPYYPDYDPARTDGYGYCRWYLNDATGTPINTDTSHVVFPTDSCKYILAVRSGYSECSNTDTIDIAVNPTPKISLSATDTILCYGESTRIMADSPDNVEYGWTHSSTHDANIIAKPDTTSTYTVTATLVDGARCSKDTSITIVVDHEIHLRPEVTPTHCGQSIGEITMHATGGDSSFVFASFPASAIFVDSIASRLAVGSYVVTATDGMACTQSITVEVPTVPGPTPCFRFASNDNVSMIITNCTTPSDDNNIYNWDFGDGVTSSETHPIHEYMEPGRYTVRMEVIDPYNCVDSMSQDYKINGPVYIPNAFTPNGDSYNNVLEIIGKTIQEKDFLWAIYDRHGSLVFISNTPKKGWDGTLLNGKKASPGVYTYHLKYLDVNGNRFERDGNITLIR